MRIQFRRGSHCCDRCGEVGAAGCECGSGTVLAIAIIGVIVSLTLSAMLVGQSVVAATRARVAADAAALAAADTASGRVAGGDPCDRAAAITAAHHVELVACEATPRRARVEVSMAAGPLRMRVVSVAGQPGG